MLPAAGSAWARWWLRTTSCSATGWPSRRCVPTGCAGRIGITNACTPVRAASAEPADVAAAARYDAVANGCYNDPVLLGRYPAELAELAPAVDLSAVRAGDLAVIAAPLDFLGINYYFPTRVRPRPAATRWARIGCPSRAWRTAFDWPVVPDGLRELLVGLSDRYGDAVPRLRRLRHRTADAQVVVQLVPEADRGPALTRPPRCCGVVGVGASGQLLRGRDRPRTARSAPRPGAGGRTPRRRRSARNRSRAM